VKKSVVARSRSLRNLKREPCSWGSLNRFGTIVTVLESFTTKVLFIPTAEIIVRVKRVENVKSCEKRVRERERGRCTSTDDGRTSRRHTTSYYSQRQSPNEVETNKIRPVQDARFRERDERERNEQVASFPLSLLLFRSLALAAPQDQSQTSLVISQQLQVTQLHFISSNSFLPSHSPTTASSRSGVSSIGS